KSRRVLSGCLKSSVVQTNDEGPGTKDSADIFVVGHSPIVYRQRKELSMYARQQAALAELTQAVLAHTDLVPLMRQAGTLVAHTLAVAYSAIWELLPDQRTLAFRFGAGWQEDAVEGTTVEVEATSPIGSTVLGTTPTMIEDWPSETRFKQPQLLRDHYVI